MNVTSWRATVNSRRFALTELCIVAIGGAALCFNPSVGIWAIAFSLIPWGFRFVVGAPPFRRTRLDLLVAVFLLTAVVGAWASYDQLSASRKLYLIIEAVILYYTLSSQPNDNVVWVSAAFFCIGVGVAGYFFLTHDFVSVPRKIELVNLIGRGIMWLRPEIGWRAMHPNYVAGIAAMMAPFGFYLLSRRQNSKFNNLIVLGLIVIASALVMTTSRGIMMAIFAALGVLLIWIGIKFAATLFRRRCDPVFPSSVIFYLLIVAVLIYVGPAQSVSSVSATGVYGNGSRAELFTRSLYLAADFPIIGGGLASFPGLYSQYILDIPIYYLPNSHNMFLDVFIEQGMFGGMAFLTMYLISIWRVSKNIATRTSHINNLYNWVALTSLIVAFVHGMVDDYLYQGTSAILSMALLGVVPNPYISQPVSENASRPFRRDIIRFAVIGVTLAALVIFFQKTIRSVWYSNLGAIQMARVELSGFPTNQWADPSIVERMQDAETSLLASVEADPSNRTANHRLGLIAMLRQDFHSAEVYLSNAYRESPRHRGIVKSLGYCRVWVGDFDNAQFVLAEFPEAKAELDSYVWWWQVHGRSDLSKRASAMRILLGATHETVLP